MKNIIIILSLLLSGCISNDIKIEATKPYEGHYFSKKEVEEAVSLIKDKLEQDETIWIIQGKTLSRTLKNIKD